MLGWVSARQNKQLVAGFAGASPSGLREVSVDRRAKRLGAKSELVCASITSFSAHTRKRCPGDQTPFRLKARIGFLVAAEVPQIDHRVGQRFQRVVHFADDLEPIQHAAELVFTGKHAFDRTKAFLEDRRVE